MPSRRSTPVERRVSVDNDDNKSHEAALKPPVGKKINVRRTLHALIALVMTLAAATAAGGQEAVQILTSPDRNAPQLDRQTLRGIFLMRVRQWPDGTPVHVFVLPADSELHDRFSREVLGTYPYVLERSWDRMVFTGTGLAPEAVRSEKEMR